MATPEQPPKKPKSILKKKSSVKPTAQAKVTLPDDPNSQESRNRATAIHRATLLQSQKDVEALILASIESLLDLPSISSSSASPAPASAPSAADLQTLQTALDPFRPLDFDELLEERHAAGLCGYALCGRPPRTSESGRGKWKIGGTGAGTEGVVERRKYEMWCSDACARRAMYVRVQLDDTPAWLRDDYRPPPVKLMPEKKAGDDKKNEGDGRVKFAAAGAGETMVLPVRPKKAVVLESEQKKALADERGDSATSQRSGGLLRDMIVEKEVSQPVVAPSKENNDSHEIVEGYQVGSKPSQDTLEDLLHF